MYHNHTVRMIKVKEKSIKTTAHVYLLRRLRKAGSRDLRNFQQKNIRAPQKVYEAKSFDNFKIKKSRTTRGSLTGLCSYSPSIMPGGCPHTYLSERLSCDNAHRDM